MDKIRILGLRKDKADILAMLQDDGVVELIETNQAFLASEETSEESNEEADSTEKNVENTPKSEKEIENSEMDANIQAAQNNRARIESTIKFLEDKYPNISVDKDKLKIDADDFLNISSKEEEILASVEEIQSLQEELQNYASDKAALDKEQTLLREWLDIDLNLAENKTEKTCYFVGSVAKDHFEDFQDAFKEAEFPNSVITLKENENAKFIAVVTMKKDELEADHLLKQSVFHSIPITKNGTPKQLYAKNESSLSDIQTGMTRAENELTELANQKLQYYVLSDYYTSMIEKYVATGYSDNTASTFVVEGYVQSDLSSDVKQTIENKYTAFVEIEELPEDAEYPILLKNKPFSSAFQSILEMFGAPNTREIDPTPGLAPFYFIFFGMMLSDVGYGGLLTIACAFLLFKKKVDVDSETGNLVKMLFLCGISATTWGFVFGGFFGDVLTVMTDGRVNFPVLWFNPMEDPQRLMIWSMIFGVIHLFGGLAMKIVNEIKFGKISNAIFDVIPWYLLITGLGLLAGGSSINFGSIDFVAVGKWMAIIGAGIILLFAGRDKKNPIARLFSGVGSLYNAIGFLGDILSYTRVLALVLATSVIATVVNFLAKMVTGSAIGWIAGSIILLGGHMLNLALSALSAYVHSSRLQYVEFFGKFFEGGGNFFKPLKYQTKRIKIKK